MGKYHKLPFVVRGIAVNPLYTLSSYPITTKSQMIAVLHFPYEKVEA